MEMQPLPHLPAIHFVRPVSTAAQDYLEDPTSPMVSALETHKQYFSIQKKTNHHGECTRNPQAIVRHTK